VEKHLNTIFRDFLTEQARQITALAAESDILDVVALEPQLYLLRYDCTGLVEHGLERIAEHRGFMVAVYLHDDFLRKVNAPLLLTLVEPRNCWHPSARSPLLCLGHIDPGTPLVELATRAYELLTFQNLGSSERDALRPEACRFVRNNLARLPIDSRPLKWRRPGGSARCSTP
jgi:hypothetical protein